MTNELTDTNGMLEKVEFYEAYVTLMLQELAATLIRDSMTSAEVFEYNAGLPLGAVRKLLGTDNLSKKDLRVLATILCHFKKLPDFTLRDARPYQRILDSATKAKERNNVVRKRA